MAGNHLKRCALMRWSFSILNDDTKCLVWWVNNRNTEAKKARPKIMFLFLRMAGNHLKRRALMRWSFSILNDNTKCLVWWVNSRNTEAKKARPKIMYFFKNGWEPSQKMRLDALIIFHIEWRAQVSSLVGKQLKYWSKKGKTENHVGMFHLLPGQHQSFHCRVYLGMSQKAKDKHPLKMLKSQW